MSLPIIRCSSLDRILSCPGSMTVVPLVRKLERMDGDEGSYIHYQIAKRLIRELGATPPDGGLQEPKLSPAFKFLPANAWIIDWCVRYVCDNIPSDWSLLVEIRMSYVFDGFILSGQHDVLAMSPDGKQTIGIDWKSVRVAADPAESNEQVAGYIALQRKAWPEIERAEFHIVQPRVQEEDGIDRVSKVVVDGAQLDAIAQSLTNRVGAALNDRMTLNTGKTQCRWCPAKLQCPAIQVEIELMKMSLTPALLAKISSEPNDALLGDLVIRGRLIEHALEDAHNLLNERLDKNGYVDAGNGTRITFKMQRGTYEVPDPVAFHEALKQIIPDETRRAKTLNFSMTRIKDEIADSMGIPKTSTRQAVTAQTIFDGALRPLVNQKQKRILVFT